MGNIIAFDVDEENFRIAIKLFDKRLDNYTPINSFLKQRKIVFLKQLPQPILLMELNYHEIRLFVKF